MSLRSPCLCYAGQGDSHDIFVTADIFFKLLKSKNDYTFILYFSYLPFWLSHSNLDG